MVGHAAYSAHRAASRTAERRASRVSLTTRYATGGEAAPSHGPQRTGVALKVAGGVAGAVGVVARGAWDARAASRVGRVRVDRALWSREQPLDAGDPPWGPRALVSLRCRPRPQRRGRVCARGPVQGPPATLYEPDGHAGMRAGAGGGGHTEVPDGHHAQPLDRSISTPATSRARHVRRSPSARTDAPTQAAIVLAPVTPYVDVPAGHCVHWLSPEAAYESAAHAGSGGARRGQRARCQRRQGAMARTGSVAPLDAVGRTCARLTSGRHVAAFAVCAASRTRQSIRKRARRGD